MEATIQERVLEPLSAVLSCGMAAGAHGVIQRPYDQGAGGRFNTPPAFYALERGDVGDAAMVRPARSRRSPVRWSADDEHADGGPLGSHGCHGEGHELGCGADAQAQPRKGPEWVVKNCESGEEVEQQNGWG